MECKVTKKRREEQIKPINIPFLKRVWLVFERKVLNLSPIMAGEIFRFRKFNVQHGRSSMRVGTDAVLLGAWAEVQQLHALAQASVLDIGCGCGVISLMIAQRCPHAQVLGVDIDAPSIEEATQNALQSPFAHRVRFCLADIRDMATEPTCGRFDLILCNPPYYTEDTLPPEQRRSRARNALHLSFESLVYSVCRIMSEQGTFALIIPMQERDIFVSEAYAKGLHISRECRVQTVQRKQPKRVMLEFRFHPVDHFAPSFLTLQSFDGSRTQEYSLLCKDFYL